MDPQYIRLIVLGFLSALSGFFLFGFFVYTIYALINWYRNKANLEKIWGGLIGLVFNLLIFLISFSRAWPPLSELIKTLIDKLA